MKEEAILTGSYIPILKSLVAGGLSKINFSTKSASKEVLLSVSALNI
jgi:hypothetical protein